MFDESAMSQLLVSRTCFPALATDGSLTVLWPQSEAHSEGIFEFLKVS